MPAAARNVSPYGWAEAFAGSAFLDACCGRVATEKAGLADQPGKTDHEWCGSSLALTPHHQLLGNLPRSIEALITTPRSGSNRHE